MESKNSEEEIDLLDSNSPHSRKNVDVIITSIKSELVNQGISQRQLGIQIGMQHPQIGRMMKGYNYHINNLLRVLEGLDMQIVIRPNRNRDNVEMEALSGNENLNTLYREYNEARLKIAYYQEKAEMLEKRIAKFEAKEQD